MSNRLTLTILAVCLFGPCNTTIGAEFRSDERPTVKADEEINDDLYIVGDEVTIDGVVKGDLVAFGRVIRVNGNVEGDLIAAGQAVVVDGTVGDDARVAGQVLQLGEASTIGDDLIGAAFSLESLESSSVGADLVYAGYQAWLGGDIGENLKAGLANCEIAGHVGGDVELSVDGDDAGGQAYIGGNPPPVSIPNVAAGLTIRDTAQIDGVLSYTSHREANIEDGATMANEVVHERPVVETQQPPTPMEKTFRVVAQYVSLLIIGVCVLLVAPTSMRNMSDKIRERPLASLGMGAIGIVGFVALLIIIIDRYDLACGSCGNRNSFRFGRGDHRAWFVVRLSACNWFLVLHIVSRWDRAQPICRSVAARHGQPEFGRQPFLVACIGSCPAGSAQQCTLFGFSRRLAGRAIRTWRITAVDVLEASVLGDRRASHCRLNDGDKLVQSIGDRFD